MKRAREKKVYGGDYDQTLFRNNGLTDRQAMLLATQLSTLPQTSKKFTALSQVTEELYHNSVIDTPRIGHK